MSQRPHVRSQINGEVAQHISELEFQDGLMEVNERTTPPKPASILAMPHTTRALVVTQENHRLRLESRKICGTRGMRVIRQNSVNRIIVLSEEDEMYVYNENLNICLKNE